MRFLPCFSAFFLFFLTLNSAGADVQGADLSHFNGEVEWDQVEKSDLRFVVLKATEGVDWVDPTFAEHWESAKKSGFVRGAYHFFVSHDDPLEEAKWYVENVELEPGDLPPIVDVERADKKDKADLSKNLKSFLEVIEDHYGVKPIIYTGAKFWDSTIGEPLDGYHLWVAHYGVPKPSLPSGWDRWTFWQYTQGGKVEGIEKEVDLNRFSESEASLESLRISPSKQTESR